VKGGRRWLTAGILIYTAILAAVTTGLFLLGRASRDRLDEALGERLAGVAVTASFLVNGDSLAVWSLDPQESLELIWLASRLEELRRLNDLAEITLTDADERVLVSAAQRLRRGEPNVFWDLDREAAESALSGFVAVTRLYRVGSLYQKSAHAPVFASDGQVTGVLTVEGNADFFAALAALRRGSLVTGGAVLVFLTVMGWLLFRLQRATERYRASVMEQENLAAMGRMTAGIAHEIRNPLGIISGTAQHLRRRLEQAGIADETAAFIPDEIDRLDRILRGYLAFGTDAAPELEPLDLAQTVRRTARLVQEELKAAGVELALDLPADGCRVQADPRRLQQILLNLLLNARDALPNPGKVTVSLHEEAQQAVLAVIDEGSGLGGVGEDKLFTPFWSSKEKGSGLGLSVARRLAEEHAGTLTLRDRTDRPGAVAELRLPLLAGGAEED